VNTDVAVVGGGPVGLLLALLLGRGGWRVEVLERQAAPFGRPRAVHLDHEAARILQNAGIMDNLATEVMDSYLWRNATGDTLLWLDGAGPAVSGWPASSMFHQPDLERLLAEAVSAQPTVSVRRGFEVIDVDSVRARWVVGCDGADSSVRRLASLSVTDLRYEAPWLIVDVLPAEPARWSPLNIQVCDPARPTTAVSGGPGRRRFEFMRLPGDPSDFGSAETAWRLLEPWGLAPANAVLERHTLYTFAARLVDRWRNGRILVAGDAAHQMPPFAGQGLCTGLRDAASLAWRLDLVLAGKAPDAILDTHGTERGPQVRAEIDFSVELGKIICELDPSLAAARDESLLPLAGAGPMPIPDRPPPGPGILLPDDPNAGKPALQAAVSGERLDDARLDDVTGGGWVLLLSRAAETLPDDLARWWASLSGRSCHVTTNAYDSWFRSMDRDVALVRPDFQIFGTASGPGGAAGLVGALRSAIAVPSKGDECRTPS
jgi:flavoprotein hydroxylase